MIRHLGIQHRGPRQVASGAWVVEFIIDGIEWPGETFGSREDAAQAVERRYESYMERENEQERRRREAYAAYAKSDEGHRDLVNQELVASAWRHVQLARQVIESRNGPPRVTGDFSKTIFANVLDAMLRGDR